MRRLRGLTVFRYAAAWMILTSELIVEFEKRVEKLGWWFECFEQKNAWGEMDADAPGHEEESAPLPAANLPRLCV